ncbi:MAG: flagellar biosynthesis protein FlgA [Candidatus Viridilinea halotolerans]|uniref:Flagellar biosynthesis protein FlgA n=1 Tax=Candidatus Viridilinea halotolerans TaxID=2491704 RepID=A0A426TY63_9CHLR|nr:MAG: flagellar biosynthesis protein FlgA [Candidatus Viridilinea halotolerans]
MTTPALNSPSLHQAMTRKKSSPLPAILLAVGMLAAIGFAIFGYLESQRTEQVVVLVRDVPYGQRIRAEDLGTVELPLHRPVQLAGISRPEAIIGQYAARNLATNDLAQPTMLMAEPPTQPVYPNGERLMENMVPMPFSVEALGPVSFRDLVNIGYSDPSGDPTLCDAQREAMATGRPTRLTGAGEASDPDAAGTFRPYACRLLNSVRVLWIDGGTAYLELTPYQAQALRALQVAGLQLWGERYGIASDELPAFDRLDAGQITVPAMLAPAPTPLPREVEAEAEVGDE